MSAVRSGFKLEPLFLEGSAGALFCVVFKPVRPIGESVLICPAFAEEMNKSRRMCVLAAQSLAAAGKDVMLLDVYGTGDSAGDFSAGSVDLWTDDLLRGIDWLNKETGGAVTVIGVRFGAILAAGVARASAERVKAMILWQPVINGEVHMTQFLRLKIASEIGKSDNRATTKDLRSLVHSGGSLEVAGYTINSDLLSQIDASDLRRMDLPVSVPVHWIEQVSDSRPQPAPMSNKLIDSLRDQGQSVTVSTVSGAPFWNTVEIARAPEFIEETLSFDCA